MECPLLERFNLESMGASRPAEAWFNLQPNCLREGGRGRPRMKWTNHGPCEEAEIDPVVGVRLLGRIGQGLIGEYKLSRSPGCYLDRVFSLHLDQYAICLVLNTIMGIQTTKGYVVKDTGAQA